jgi:hypothetical protein
MSGGADAHDRQVGFAGRPEADSQSVGQGRSLEVEKRLEWRSVVRFRLVELDDHLLALVLTNVQ